MTRLVAFRMQLKPGCAAEYERRHDNIWPELAEFLQGAGISDYSIFLAQDEKSLFAVLRQAPGFCEQALMESSLMRRWSDYMADLMVVHPDNRPVDWPMRQVFRLD